jgi:hypothetical protein
MATIVIIFDAEHGGECHHYTVTDDVANAVHVELAAPAILAALNRLEAETTATSGATEAGGRVVARRLRRQRDL